MPEPRDRLSVAFTELAVSMLPEVHLPGPDAAHATVRRRRRRRVAVLAVAVAVVVLVPSAAFALLRGNGNAGPDIGNTPTPSASASPTPTPSATTPPQPPGLRVIGDANVRVSTPLDDALLPIPSFGGTAEGCPAGDTRYADGRWQGAPILTDPPIYVVSSIHQVATGDVNRDGTTDWVAAITCQHGIIQGMTAVQVVAFTRDANGPYTLLGPVFVAGGDYDASYPEVAADGVIRLIVSGPLEPVSAIVNEWRSFRWDGAGFAPVGSPVVIPTPEPTDLSLTITPSAVSGPSTVLSVTVHNAGPTSSDYLELRFSASLLDRDAGRLTSISIRPEGLPAELRPFGVCQGTDDCSWMVRLEPVPAGQSATGRITVSLPTTITGGSLNLSVTGFVRGSGTVPNATAGNGATVPITAG